MEYGDSDRWVVGRALQGDISLLNVAVRLQVSVLAPLEPYKPAANAKPLAADVGR